MYGLLTSQERAQNWAYWHGSYCTYWYLRDMDWRTLLKKSGVSHIIAAAIQNRGIRFISDFTGVAYIIFLMDHVGGN